MLERWWCGVATAPAVNDNDDNATAATAAAGFSMRS